MKDEKLSKLILPFDTHPLQNFLSDEIQIADVLNYSILQFPRGGG